MRRSAGERGARRGHSEWIGGPGGRAGSPDLPGASGERSQRSAGVCPWGCPPAAGVSAR